MLIGPDAPQSLITSHPDAPLQCISVHYGRAQWLNGFELLALNVLGRGEAIRISIAAS